MRLTVNGKRWDSALKVRIDPNDWDPIKEKATGDDSYSNLVNETIESTKFWIHKIKLSMEDEGKILTTHTARRTFATTIMLHNGVSMEAVSKMLGHTSLFMTRKYAKVDEYYIAQETEKVRELFMKKD